MPKLLFDVPDFHNPTRIAMSLARRQRLLTLAYEFGFVIVEDDPYRRLRFKGESIAPIKSLDENGIVIAVGTVSKTLAPGRLGNRRTRDRQTDGIAKIRWRILSIQSANRGGPDAIQQELPEATVCTPHGDYFL